MEAVQHFGTPLLIIAGAGAGKTMVLTQKIKYMVTELGIYPRHILAITFTNKAAREMKERTRLLLNTKEVPFISTFHGLCNDILRRDIHHLGKNSQFVIMDAA
ncbi:ATP-dependent DNA helicase PcrA, partial [bacterium]|nr:ATP-dependent DNA helicase PcrA [bacterium]